MIPLEPSGTHASAYEFVPANVRPSRWRYVVTAVLAFVIALVIVAGIASAADYALWVKLPDGEWKKVHTFTDPGAVACATDAAGMVIFKPKGTRSTCLPDGKTMEAKR